jgi:retron-type reverse transcriptase
MAIKQIVVIQDLIFSSSLRRDFKTVLKTQKQLSKSESLRFISIRYVTKISRKNILSGIDEKVSLSFKERFEIEALLKKNIINWNLQSLKGITFTTTLKNIIALKTFTIADRCWQVAVALIINPAQQAFFHPRSIGFREGYSIHNIKKLFLLNMSKSSGGLKKRVMVVEFKSNFSIYDNKYLLNKIIVFKELKICLFRALNSGLIPEFINERVSLSSLLANTLLNGIEDISPCIRFGSNIAFNIVML